METLRQSPDTLSKTLRQDFVDLISQEDIKNGSFEEKKRYMIESCIARKSSSVFRNLPIETYEGLIRRLEAITGSSDDELIEQVLAVTLSFTAEVFPDVNVLEEALREILTETRGWNILNKVFAYEVFDDHIEIHVPMVLTESPFQIMKLAVEGLKKLASMIRDDEKFKQVLWVEGISWIVFKHQKLVQSLGFTISNIDNENKAGSVRMTREDLLQRY